MRFNNLSAGSSFGSWETSLPAMARARIAKSRQGRPTITPEILIPCGDLLSPWNERDPERSDGVVEHWSFQHSDTPLLHHSGSLIFHRVRMSEPTVSTVGFEWKRSQAPRGRKKAGGDSIDFFLPLAGLDSVHAIHPAMNRWAIFGRPVGTWIWFGHECVSTISPPVRRLGLGRPACQRWRGRGLRSPVRDDRE